MKKLDQFILKSFIGPFVAILAIVVFILMLQFLWVYIDELVGKGLSFKVILEFMFWEVGKNRKTLKSVKQSESGSVVSNSLGSHGL